MLQSAFWDYTAYSSTTDGQCKEVYMLNLVYAIVHIQRRYNEETEIIHFTLMCHWVSWPGTAIKLKSFLWCLNPQIRFDRSSRTLAVELLEKPVVTNDVKMVFFSPVSVCSPPCLFSISSALCCFYFPPLQSSDRLHTLSQLLTVWLQSSWQ